jgi:hypothetical protein
MSHATAALVLALLVGFVLGFHVCNITLVRPALDLARRIAATNADCLAEIQKILEFCDRALVTRSDGRAKPDDKRVN